MCQISVLTKTIVNIKFLMIDNVARIEKPKKVNIAIRLLIVSMIISFVSGYMKGMNKPNDHKEIVTDFPI